jgi:hypothetical protein
MNAQELYVKKEDGSFKPSTTFFCETCRIVHRTKEEGDKCCQKPKPAEPKPCKYCGEVVPNTSNYTYSPSYHADCRTEHLLDKAKECEITGPDVFYDPYREEINSLENLQDHYYCEEIPEEERPEYFHFCTEDSWGGIDLERALANELEDYYCSDDDYPADKDVIALEELENFLTVWNAKQTIRTYHPDYSRKVKLVW